MVRLIREEEAPRPSLRLSSSNDLPKIAAARKTAEIAKSLGLEAMRMVEQGVASAADIDTAMKLGTNQPMGPLTLADFIGLDTCLSIAEVLHKGLGEDKYRPAPILRQHVEAGWLGKKSKRGFFVY